MGVNRASRRFTQSDDEMDITPMIDITFLLLIFFLVASTPDRQTAVDLPTARFGRGVSQNNAVITGTERDASSTCTTEWE